MVSLTSGIPQSSANPLLTILDGEEERQRKRAAWQARAIDSLDAAVLDWDGHMKDKPQPRLDFAADPDTAKKLGIVHSYLAIQSPTATAPEDPITRGVFRDRIAQERFAGRGVGDDLAFYAEIEKESTGRKDARLLMQDATSSAATAAILSAAGEPGTTYDQWITAARQRPGYRPDLEDVYFSEWRDRQRHLTEAMAPVRDLIARQWSAMKEGKTADLEGLTGYMADEEQRETLLFAIGGLVKAMPKDQQPGVLANLRKQFLRRDLPLQAEGVMNSMRPIDRDAPLPDDYLDQLEPGTNLQAFEKRHRAAFERDTQLRERFVRKLESIVFDQYDPVVTFAKEGSNWQALEKGLYAAPGVGLTIGTAMLPGAGNFISYEVLRKTSTDMARDSLIQGGFTEDQAEEGAQGIGAAAALIQLPMERLGLAALTNRIPGVSKAINKITTGLATRYLARAGASAATEFTTEMAQDLVPSILQDIAAAAGQDMPEVRWTGEGGVFQDYDKQSLEVLGAILPLSLVMAGGGVFTDRQIQATAALDDVTLQAAGMSPEAVAAVRAANGIGEQELALRSAWESRDITSESAVAAQQELTARTRADQQTAAEVARTGVMPTFYRSADGWSVRDGESGAEIGTATTPDGALRLAMAHSSAIESDNADQVAALATLLEAGDVVAATDQEGVRQTATDLRPGQVVTTSQQAAVSEMDDTRIRQQIEARERLGGSDGGTARMVLGQSITETRQKVRNTVNRINAGGSVLTVFHEESHGFFREAIATGRLTRDETLAAIRSLETVLAGKVTKDGQQLRFLPDGDVTDLQLDEAVSELMEAEILRTRKTAGRSGTAGRSLPPGLVTRNLTAMARLAPGAAAKLRDFIAAVRAFWGLTFQRAAAIKSAIREGTLDETQLEAFKSKLFGLEDQTDLEQAARDTEARILDGELSTDPLQLDGDPFSLGTAITPEQDAAYLAAVEAGNMEEAQRMVDAAAVAAGYESETYVHETTSKETFTKFKVGGPRLRPGQELTMGDIWGEKLSGHAIWFRPQQGERLTGHQKGAKRQIAAKLKLRAPLMEDRDGIELYGGFSQDFPQVVQPSDTARLKELGRDSVVYTDKGEIREVLIFEPSQAKSADPVTRDETGNVIPLSQRFNPADDRLAYSLGPAALADLLGKDAVSRIKDPVRRAQAMSRIAREMEAARLQFERLELVAGSKRLKKSLAREASIREALRREELENETMARHWQVLSDDDLVKIKSQPAHRLLSDPANPLRGRIQSRTETIRKNPDLYTFKDPAEYNGSETVTRTIFGGTLTPDLAVEELVHEGLLPPGSNTDALWSLLNAEALSVSNRKRDLEIARQELREARTQAKDETNVWLREQGVVQETTFSDKQEILRALGVLDGILSSVPAEIRGKIGGYTQLARIASNEAKLSFLKDRLAKVDTELEKWLRVQFDREFRALLDRAKPEKDEAGKKPRGKIGADVHELFAAVRESMTMTGAEVEADAVALESLVASGDYTAAQESHMTLQANLIRLAGDWAKADAARREAALVEATSIYNAGYMAHKIQTLQKREKRQKVRDALQTATGKAGTREERRERQTKDEGSKAGRALTTLFSLMSFEQVVSRAFGADTQEARDLVDWERHAAHAKADSVQNKLDQLDDLFASLAGGKLKGEQLRFAMAQPDMITVDGHTFSELEAITATLMWRQEDGRRHMEGHVDDQGAPAGDWNYTQAFVDQLEAKLSTNAKAVRLHLAEQYAAEYDRLNAVFRDLNGVSLPRHKHYSPLTVTPQNAQGGQMLDPVTGSAMTGAGFTPGSLKNRSQSAIAEPDFRDALQVYIAHAKQMEHWIAYAPFAAEAMAILNTRDLGNSVQAAAGKEALSVLRSWLDVFAQGGTRDAAAHLAFNKGLARVTGRAAATALVGRVSVLAIQSTQLVAAAFEMPVASYVSRLARLFTGRLDWSGALASDYIQRRKAQMPPVVQQAMEGLTGSKPRRLKYLVRKMGETISGADALFTAGTFAIVLDYQTKQAKALGLNGAAAKAFAIEAAERATDRVAQPVRTGTRSLYEVSSVSPLARISWAFASDARQKLAILAFKLAYGSTQDKARAVAVTAVLGVMATIIRAAMRDIRDDGEDDEIFDEKNWDAKRLTLSTLTSPFAGIPALGDLLEGAAFKAFDEYLPEGNMISGGIRAGDTIGNLPDWASGEREGLENAIKDAESLSGGLGLGSDSAAALTSILHLARDLFGIVENVTD